MDATGSTGYSQEDDEKILFRTAAAGGEVPIEDLLPGCLETRSADIATKCVKLI